MCGERKFPKRFIINYKQLVPLRYISISGKKGEGLLTSHFISFCSLNFLGCTPVTFMIKVKPV